MLACFANPDFGCHNPTKTYVNGTDIYPHMPILRPHAARFHKRRISSVKFTSAHLYDNVTGNLTRWGLSRNRIGSDQDQPLEFIGLKPKIKLIFQPKMQRPMWHWTCDHCSTNPTLCRSANLANLFTWASGEQISQKWEIPCLRRSRTAVQKMTPLALSSAEQSVKVQTHKQ